MSGARQSVSDGRVVGLFLALQNFSAFAAFVVYLLNLRVFICLNAARATPHLLTSADCHLVTSRVLQTTEVATEQADGVGWRCCRFSWGRGRGCGIADTTTPYRKQLPLRKPAAKANISLEFAHESGQSNASNTNNTNNTNTTKGSSATSTYMATCCWWFGEKSGARFGLQSSQRPRIKRISNMCRCKLIVACVQQSLLYYSYFQCF